MSPELPSGAIWVLWIVVPLSLVLTTSFVKISILLTFLRSGIGAPEVPSTIVITAVAVLLSGFVMMPVASETWEAVSVETAPSPSDQEPSIEQWLERAAAVYSPLENWLSHHAGDDEAALFTGLSTELNGEGALSARHPMILVPAFVLTELKEAFLAGFLILVPFIVVDLAVANVLMTVGVSTLEPGRVSMPLKLLLFVMMDGWTLLVEGIVLGYT